MRALPALLLAAVAVLAPEVRAGDPPPKPAPAPGPRRSKAFTQAVDRAIVRGVQFLRTLQLADGSFGLRAIPMFYVSGEGSLGPTALAVYTLRACGAPPDDPAVKRGLQRLREMYDSRKRGAKGLDNYGVSLTLLALEAQYAAEAAPPSPGDRYGKPAPDARRIPEADLEWMRELARWLVAAQTKVGSFSYWSPAQGRNWDHSNLQYSLLALKAARRCGIEVPRALWARAAEHLLDEQEKKGPAVGRYEPGSPYADLAKDAARGWGYTENTPATGSMTAGCLSALVICRSELIGAAGAAPALDGKVVQGIRDGAAWLGLYFKVDGNPGPAGAPAVKELWHHYYLYGLERAGVLSGLVWFGRHDWYLEGAQFLVDGQRDNGSWLSQEALDANPWKGPEGAGPDAATANFLDTCFALLFLKRATFKVDQGAVATEEAELDLDGAGALEDEAFAPLFEAAFARFRATPAADRDARATDFVRMGKRSIPLLLRRLESEDGAERGAAIAALGRVAGGDRGFAADGPAAARAAAVAAWETWWIASRDRIVPDLPAGCFRVAAPAGR
jgi:hypothetical protein